MFEKQKIVVPEDPGKRSDIFLSNEANKLRRNQNDGRYEYSLFAGRNINLSSKAFEKSTSVGSIDHVVEGSGIVNKKSSSTHKCCGTHDNDFLHSCLYFRARKAELSLQ